MAHVCPWWGGYFIDNPLRRWLHDPDKTDFLVEYKGVDGKWHSYSPDCVIRRRDGRCRGTAGAEREVSRRDVVSDMIYICSGAEIASTASPLRSTWPAATASASRALRTTGSSSRKRSAL